jgi:hypothetical protein
MKNHVFYNVVVPICQVFSLFIYLFLIELWSYMCQLTLLSVIFLKSKNIYLLVTENVARKI